MDVEAERRRSRHVLRELGFALRRSGDELHGSARVVPQMWVPGTSSLRTSILAAWADHATGLLAVDVFAPRVPTTLELDVQLYQPAPGHGTVRAAARTIKAGRSVVVLTVDFTDGDGEPIAVGTGAFMATPDPGLTMPPGIARPDPAPDAGKRLRVPFAERAGCTRREPGVAVLHRSDDGINIAHAVNGALIALVIEEAALSLTPGATLSSLAMHFLRPVRVGPAVATADVRAGLGRVEVRDAGSDDRLGVVGTTRTFAEPS